MKILIAYDGSESAQNAIDDLKYAGLPAQEVEATLLSVGEVRMRSEPVLNLEAAFCEKLAIYRPGRSVRLPARDVQLHR